MFRTSIWYRKIMGAQPHVCDALRNDICHMQADSPVCSVQLVVAENLCPGQVFAAGESGCSHGDRIAEKFLCAAGYFYTSRAHDRHPRAHLIDFVPAVRHHQHIFLIGAAKHAFHLLQKLLPKIAVQGGKWLIQKQDIRIGSDDSRQGDPLLLTAGQSSWQCVCQLRYMELFQQVGNVLVLLLPGGEFFSGAGQPRLHILPHRHVRKQRVLLKEIAHLSLLRRYIYFSPGVKQHTAVECDPAGIRRLDSRDTFEGHALSAARRAKKSHTAAFQVKIHLQFKIFQLFSDVYCYRHLFYLLSYLFSVNPAARFPRRPRLPALSLPGVFMEK